MIKFYKNRFIFFGISLALIIIGIIFTLINGVNLDIQFKGGCILKYSYTGTLEAQQVENDIKDSIHTNVTVQLTNDIATNEQKLVLNLSGEKNLTVEEQQKLDKLLTSTYPSNSITLSSSNTVEPFIGQRFLKRGLLAILISFIFIVIYVWVRFKNISGLSAGIMALVALFHDCLIVLATFIIFKIPINESFIAVILTIVGYSVNDTIIIYDRIRENSKNGRKRPSMLTTSGPNEPKSKHLTQIDLVDLSITQSMSRSINTCLTTLAGALIIFIFAYFFGIDSIITFALPMAVGIISGCYSTICIAGPLWLSWQLRKKAS